MHHSPQQLILGSGTEMVPRAFSKEIFEVSRTVTDPIVAKEVLEKIEPIMREFRVDQELAIAWGLLVEKQRFNKGMRLLWDDLCTRFPDDLTALRRRKVGDVALCDDGYSHTAPAGTFQANAFGLHDMIGNVAEWVEDCYVSNYYQVPTNGSAYSSDDCAKRVSRGGSWLLDVIGVRSAFRSATRPSWRSSMVGFRVARDLK